MIDFIEITNKILKEYMVDYKIIEVVYELKDGVYSIFVKFKDGRDIKGFCCYEHEDYIYNVENFFRSFVENLKI